MQGQQERTLTLWWWTCPLCLDRMASSIDRARVTRDQQLHLEHHHPGVTLEGRALWLSHWPATELTSWSGSPVGS